MMNFYGMTREMLRKYFVSQGEGTSKAKFLMRAVYGGAEGPTEGISEELMRKVKRDISFELPTVEEKREDDTACKYLLRLPDGCTVETVRMKEPYGDAVCVSTQVGCNMGCVFCESGRLKKVRDLEAWEITTQVIAAARDSGRKICSVTVMGIGEPLDNYGETVKFIEIVTDQFGLSIPPRRVTVSTAGLVPQIKKLAADGVLCNLAVSLHAPDDELRRRLMPVDRKYPVGELISAMREFSEMRNRRVAVEYMLMSGVNSSPACAQKLAELLAGIKCYVNIIAYNPTGRGEFKTAEREETMAFYDVLKKNGVRVTLRRKMGEGLSAACGQLRSDSMNASRHESMPT